MSNEWESVALKDALSRIQSGYWGEEHPTEERSNMVRVIRNADVTRDGRRKSFAVRALSNREREKSALTVGDIALAASGEVGKAWLVDEDGYHVTNFLKRLTVNPSVARPEFVRYLLDWEPLKRDMAAHTGGSAIQNLRRSFFESVSVALPPLAEQRRIADLLGSVDGYIDSLQTQVEVTRAARSALLAELLSDQSNDWSESVIGEVVSLQRRRIDPTRLGEDVKLLHWSIPGLDATGGPLSESASQIGSHKFQLSSDCVLLSLLNPRIPRYAIAEGGSDVVCSTEFAALTPKDAISLHFLACIVSAPAFLQQVLGLAQGTTKSRERVKPSDLLALPIRLPDLSEQQRIVHLISSIDRQVSSLESLIDSAQSLRSGILSQLLSGERLLDESYDVAVSP